MKGDRDARARIKRGLNLEPISEGTVVAVAEGREAGHERFRPDRDFEERSLPAVRAPQEGASCLQRLAALAALGV